MTENTSAEEASALLGGRFINLSLTAADFFERSLVLDDIFRRRRINRVVYTLDHIYINTRKGYPLYPLQTFDFLYDRNPLNDVRAYLNAHFADCMFRFSSDAACVGSATSLDRPNAWFAQPEYASRFGGIRKWCESIDNYQIRDAHKLIRKAIEDRASGIDQSPSQAEVEQRIRSAIQYVDQYVISHVRQHPETHFHFFFPPYFRATYAIWHQARPIHAAIHLAVIRHFAHKADELPNMDVSGFEDADTLDNLANYKDLGHYRETIDSQILSAIAAKRNRITGQTVDSYVQAATERAKGFDLNHLDGELAACSSKSAQGISPTP